MNPSGDPIGKFNDQESSTDELAIFHLRHRIQLQQAVLTGLDNWDLLCEAARAAPDVGTAVQRVCEILEVDELSAQIMMSLQIDHLTDARRKEAIDEITGLQGQLESILVNSEQ